MRVVLVLAAACIAWTAAVAGVEVPLDAVDGVASLTTEGLLQAIGLVGTGACSGTLRLGGCDRAVCVEQVASGAPTLSADLAGSGIRETVEWSAVSADGYYTALPQFLIPSDADGEQLSAYRLCVIWSPALPGVLVYLRDTYRAGTAMLDGRDVRLALLDEDSDGAYDDLQDNALIVDLDGDGRLSASGDSHERFGLGEPFCLGGQSYVVVRAARDGSSLAIEESSLLAIPKPPLLPGFVAPLFEASDLNGQRVALGDLRGQVVLLDFWAGWCAPCVAELPTVRRVHEEYAARGVVIVSISLDRSEAACRAAVSDYGLATVQVFDGPQGELSALYRIQGIPMTYLIDRDGTIWARGLRGDSLLAEVGELASRSMEGEGD